jgi:hypothetical protein
MSWVIGNLSNSHRFSSVVSIKTKAGTPKLETARSQELIGLLEQSSF